MSPISSPARASANSRCRSRRSISALDRLRNYVASTPDPGKNGGRDLAYALYVLARNGVAPVGDLRYIADTKLGELATPIAKAQVAAALAMLGDSARAERVYLAALDAIAPPPQLDSGAPTTARRCAMRRAGDARLGRARDSADDRRRGPRVEAARARPAAPRPRRMPGWCSPPARSARRPTPLAFGGGSAAGHDVSQSAGRRTEGAARGQQQRRRRGAERWCR